MMKIMKKSNHNALSKNIINNILQLYNIFVHNIYSL